MKRNLLILICTIILCFSLVSCGLKNAIIGNKNDTSPDESKVTTSNPEIESDITNNESNEKDVNADANNNESTDNVILDNNDSLTTEDSTSNNTIEDKSSISTTSKSVNRDCRVFYFNKVDLKTYCTDISVAVIDNALVTALTEKLYESPNSNNNFLVLSKDYGVKSATLDYETNILKVVFNENFIDAMKLDSETANGLMLAIVNTYGYNYEVEKVAVYFGDELYTGLEGTSSVGYSTVDYTTTLKLD